MGSDFELRWEQIMKNYNWERTLSVIHFLNDHPEEKKISMNKLQENAFRICAIAWTRGKRGVCSGNYFYSERKANTISLETKIAYYCNYRELPNYDEDTTPTTGD